MKEIILPGETGLLIPLAQQPDSPFEAIHPEVYAHDLATGINTLMRDPPDVPKWARRAGRGSSSVSAGPRSPGKPSIFTGKSLGDRFAGLAVSPWETLPSRAMKPILLTLSLSLLLPFSSALAETWSAPIEQLRKVGREGAGNNEAAAAWNALTALGSEMLVPVLAAMDGSSPLARNWMRTAVETVFDRELRAGKTLPGDAIKAFVLDRNNEPNARRLAFDLYLKLAPDDAAALIPGFADDPSPALRRDAVAKLLAEGKTQLEAGARDQSLATLRKALDAARDADQIDAVTKLLREKLEEKVDLPMHFGSCPTGTSSLPSTTPVGPDSTNPFRRNPRSISPPNTRARMASR